MIVIDIFVPGEPVGKGRPRFSRKNGVAYTPAKTRSYEGIVRQFAAEKMRGAPPVEGPMGLNLWITVAVPSSWPEWKRELAHHGTLWPTSRPDADNVEKGIKDALNQVVWKDDCQVVSVNVNKAYSPTPGVKIVVFALPGHPCQITKRPQ